MMMLPFKVARIQSLFAADLFLSFLLFKREGEVPEVNKPRRACLYFTYFKPALLSRLLHMCSDWEMVIINTYALISTSTPDGKSNLLRASTVLEEEV